MIPELLVSLPNLMEYAVPRRDTWPADPRAVADCRITPTGRDPRRPARKLAMDPELIPRARRVRPFLFPSVHALAVDDQGIRFHFARSVPVVQSGDTGSGRPGDDRAGDRAVRPAGPIDRQPQADRRSPCTTYHDVNNRFPADVLSKDGKPLLSWRVAILPQLGHQALYTEFHQDEPWDSPHNKALLERMPEVFAVLGGPGRAGH